METLVQERSRHGQLEPARLIGINRITSAPVMIEGLFGMHDETGVGNLELCVEVNGQVEHWWRDNAAGARAQWHRSVVFGQERRSGCCVTPGTLRVQPRNDWSSVTMGGISTTGAMQWMAHWRNSCLAAVARAWGARRLPPAKRLWRWHRCRDNSHRWWCGRSYHFILSQAPPTPFSRPRKRAFGFRAFSLSKTGQFPRRPGCV